MDSFFTVKQEYEGDGEDGSDSLCISRTALLPGDRVLLIDDLIATGGTLLAGVELVKQQQVYTPSFFSLSYSRKMFKCAITGIEVYADVVMLNITFMVFFRWNDQTQAQVVEAACMIELTYLDGGKKVREKHPEVKVRTRDMACIESIMSAAFFTLSPPPLLSHPFLQMIRRVHLQSCFIMICTQTGMVLHLRGAPADSGDGRG